jgi:hypothetical protein
MTGGGGRAHRGNGDGNDLEISPHSMASAPAWNLKAANSGSKKDAAGAGAGGHGAGVDASYPGVMHHSDSAPGNPKHARKSLAISTEQMGGVGGSHASEQMVVTAGGSHGNQSNLMNMNGTPRGSHFLDCVIPAGKITDANIEAAASMTMDAGYSANRGDAMQMHHMQMQGNVAVDRMTNANAHMMGKPLTGIRERLESQTTGSGSGGMTNSGDLSMASTNLRAQSPTEGGAFGVQSQQMAVNNNGNATEHFQSANSQMNSNSHSNGVSAATSATSAGGNGNGNGAPKRKASQSMTMSVMDILNSNRNAEAPSSVPRSRADTGMGMDQFNANPNERGATANHGGTTINYAAGASAASHTGSINMMTPFPAFSQTPRTGSIDLTRQTNSNLNLNGMTTPGAIANANRPAVDHMGNANGNQTLLL